MPRDYKIRVGREVPEATSQNVAAWIEEVLQNGTTLLPDPATIALRLDSEKVVELANKKRERVPVMLRRLIATKADLPPEYEKKSAGAAAAELLPDKVLPRKLAFTTEDFLKIVHGMDKGMVIAYRRIYGMKDLEAAQTAEEDRELASAMAECANRRSPKWLIENADLAKLAFSLMHWTAAQTEQLEQAAVEENKKRPAAPAAQNGKSPQPELEEPSSAPIPGAAEILAAHAMEPAQQEGEF
jgi:hypothetical protein